MAANSNPSLIGSNSALGTPAFDDLYLPIYGGEVLTRYSEALVATSMLKTKTIQTGNTAVFPRLGGLSAERHGRGVKLLGQDTVQSEIEITLDKRPLVSHFRIDDIDEMMLHFESRSEYSSQAGEKLAERQDALSMRLAINASRETPTTMYGGTNSPFPGGGIDGEGNAITKTALPATVNGTWDADAVGALLEAIDEAAVRWDDVRVPFSKRVMIVPVKAWHAMKNFGSPRSEADIKGSSSITVPPLFQDQQGWHGAQPNPGMLIPQMPDFQVPLVYNGVLIYRSNIFGNEVAGQDLTGDDEAKYNGDFTDTRAILFQEEAAAIAWKMQIMTEADRDVSRQDWLNKWPLAA